MTLMDTSIVSLPIAQPDRITLTGEGGPRQRLTNDPAAEKLRRQHRIDTVNEFVYRNLKRLTENRPRLREERADSDAGEGDNDLLG